MVHCSESLWCASLRLNKLEEGDDEGERDVFEDDEDDDVDS